MRAVRLPLLVHGFPFFPGGESRAAAAKEFRLDGLANHALRAPFERSSQGFVTAESAVILETGWIHLPHAAQESQLRSSVLRDRNLRIQRINFVRQLSCRCI